ncbi:MAG: glycosyltransferase [Deltaproteobacteria bacterium]|nr:glycosyltransferase [Deltaproteobacteria bacterium]
MRILIVCEKLADRDDEGIKNVARHLLLSLGARHEVLALSRERWQQRSEVVSVPMGRFFLNADLLRRARTFRPDATIYVPWTSGTPPTFVRARVLGLATGAPVALVLCQPYPLPAAVRALIRFLLPSAVFAMSPGVVREIGALGGRARFLAAGVELSRFRLPTPAERDEQRRVLGVGKGEKLVLHVGHLNRRRLDPDEIVALTKTAGRRIVIVCSPATPQDEGIRRQLETAGVRILSEFLPQIERIYWGADAYLFPTTEPRNCIGVPLSVLEALASGLSVVATPFEGLPVLFPDTPHVRFGSTADERSTLIDLLPAPASTQARDLVASLGWDEVAQSLVRTLTRRAD